MTFSGAMKFSHGGLINNLALAVQYHRAASTSEGANPARGLWNRLLSAHFNANTWILTPLDDGSGTLKSNFVIERFYPKNNTIAYLPWVLVQVKAQVPDSSNEDEEEQYLSELDTDAGFLSLDASWYMRRKADIQSTVMFVIQVSGVRMRVYKRTISREEDSFKSLTGFLDPKIHPQEIRDIFKVVQTQNFTEISSVSFKDQTATSGQLKRKLEDDDSE